MRKQEKEKEKAIKFVQKPILPKVMAVNKKTDVT